MLVAQGAAAQTRWIQIEAQPSEREALARLQAWAGAFPDVSAYALTTGWFGIVLGPYAADDAALRLGLLRDDRLIPGDSFLADGRNFRARIGPQSDTPAPPAPAPTVVTEGETLADARRDEAALDRPAREEIQTALAWFGHYAAAIDGAFGPGTRAAIGAWQAAEGAEATGVLTARQRTALIAAWRAGVAELGLTRVTEAEAGIEIDLPLGLVAFAGYEPPFVQYTPRGDSGVRVVLISQPGDQGALFALYDLLQAAEMVPPDGPRERRARSFEIRGSNAMVETYAYAELTGGLIKGYLLSWRTPDAVRMGRVLAAMRGSFRAIGDRALDPALEPLDPAVKAGMMTGLEPRRPARERSGAFVDARGTVLTAAEAVAGCGSVTVEGGVAADVVLRDEAAGIAVLRPRVPLAPARLAGAGALPRPGAEVAVAGFPFGAALAVPVLTFGTFAAEGGLAGEAGVARARLAALPGDIGGPVLDAAGAVVGILLPQGGNGRRILPEDVAYFAPVAVVAPVLEAGGIAVPTAVRSGAMAPEDVTAIGRALAVQVSCWN
ncbi:MAG: serine protease [Gemmobacter sp.]